MEKIKVLHLHTLPIISGSGINTLLTMAGLDKEKYEVHFACAPGGSLIDKVKEEGIRYYPIEDLVQEISPYNDLRALLQIIRLLRKERYDIVHTHNSKAGFIGRLAARLSSVPIIIHTVHGFSFHRFEKPIRRVLFTALERLAAIFTDKIIVISNALKEWGLRLHIGKPDQYITIYSGIDIDKFKAEIDINKKRQEFKICPDDLVIGVTSKLWEGKGHRTILKAVKDMVKEVPNIKIMFVGNGYLMNELKDIAHNYGLDNYVVFTGFRSDIPEITNIFDIAVLASSFEGLGRVLLEAMAAGKPVIASKVGGILDIVEDKRTGILVEPCDAEGLKSAIIRLVKDPGLRSIMGKEGKKKVDTKFSSARMVDMISGVYEEMLKKRKDRYGRI